MVRPPADPRVPASRPDRRRATPGRCATDLTDLAAETTNLGQFKLSLRERETTNLTNLTNPYWKRFTQQPSLAASVGHMAHGETQQSLETNL